MTPRRALPNCEGTAGLRGGRCRHPRPVHPAGRPDHRPTGKGDPQDEPELRPPAVADGVRRDRAAGGKRNGGARKTHRNRQRSCLAGNASTTMPESGRSGCVGQDEGVRALTDTASRRGLVPDLKRPEIDGRARIQSPRRHADRACRKGRRNEQVSPCRICSQEGVSSYAIGCTSFRTGR